MSAPATYVALVHYPVYDRNRRIVTTALTNLDLHDTARSCRTFGVAGCFIVTPVAAQQELARSIVAHWSDGAGLEQNALRSEAVKRVMIAATVAEACEVVQAREGAPPLIVVTAARAPIAAAGPKSQGPALLAAADFPALCRAHPGRPALLLFGTGWGLADEVRAGADAQLTPIARAEPTTAMGTGHDITNAAPTYNHLSVRAAVGIVLDRLFGRVDLGTRE